MIKIQAIRKNVVELLIPHKSGICKRINVDKAASKIIK